MNQNSIAAMQTSMLGSSSRSRLSCSAFKALSQLPRFHATPSLHPAVSNTLSRQASKRIYLLQAAKSVEAELIQDENIVPSFETSHGQIDCATDESLVSKLLKGFWKVAAVGALCLVLVSEFFGAGVLLLAYVL